MLFASIRAASLLIASICSAVCVQAARLSGPEREASGVRLLLHGESNAVYLLEQSTNLTDWTVALRSDALTPDRALFCQAPPARSFAFYRAARTNEPLFRFAIATRSSIELNGNNLLVDSFDSGAFQSNAPQQTARGDRGYVSCNESLIDSIGFGSAVVYGRLHVGSNGTATIGPNGLVGDMNVHADPSNRGKVLPGWVSNDAAFSYPEVTLPFAETNTLTPMRDKDYEGVRYNFAFFGGDFWLPADYTLSGKIYVVGTNRVVCKGRILLSGTDRIVLRTNAMLELYADGREIRIGGMGLINPGAAQNCLIFGTTNCTNMNLAGNATMTSAVYAPEAFIQMNGAGMTTTNDFYGAIVGRSIKLNGDFSYHFDEALLRSGPFR